MNDRDSQPCSPFPNAYDGARLHVRLLVVPRLDTGWSGDPLQPLIVDMPAPGDTTDPFADADLQFEAARIEGARSLSEQRDA